MRIFTAILSVTFLIGLLGEIARCKAHTPFAVAKLGCYARTSTPDQKVSYCTQIIKSGRLSRGNLAWAFVNRGNVYLLEKRDFDRAIQDYDSSLRAWPGFLNPLYNRGLAYMAKGNDNQAIQDFNQTIRLDPGHARPFVGRGRAYLGSGDYARAVQDFNQALQLDPHDLYALFEQGCANLALGKFAKAQQDLLEAERLAPDDPNAVFALYIARTRAGQDARSELQEEAAKLPQTALTVQLSNLLLGKTTPNAVLSAFDATDPIIDRDQHCAVYFYLGENALFEHNRTDAMHFFRQALDTGDVESNYYPVAQAELRHPSPAGQTNNNHP